MKIINRFLFGDFKLWDWDRNDVFIKIILLFYFYDFFDEI